MATIVAQLSDAFSALEKQEIRVSEVHASVATWKRIEKEIYPNPRREEVLWGASVVHADLPDDDVELVGLLQGKRRVELVRLPQVR